ncbi:hypothetical protein, partial [Chryseobacterium sp. SIMBA_038]|uniref:hypothetical protein n=1 Tax=Chryseobacterium sp. SIMBA_038 TaxID=3085780 RepID=UPI0039795BDF
MKPANRGPAAHHVCKRQQVRTVAYVTVPFFSASIQEIPARRLGRRNFELTLGGSGNGTVGW